MVSRTRFFSASLSSVTLHRLGRKRRLVRRLAWLTLLPVSTALPVSSQRRAMALLSFFPWDLVEPGPLRRAAKGCHRPGRYTGMAVEGQGVATKLRQGVN